MRKPKSSERKRKLVKKPGKNRDSSSEGVPALTSRLLVLGLGNPGERFAGTRHNAGSRIIGLLARQLDIRYKKPLFSPFRYARVLLEGREQPMELILVHPLTFMNRSGRIVPAVMRRFGVKAEQLLVVCDHLDLETGQLRLKRKGSAGGQRGLQSGIDSLGHNDFPRLFVGIGRPKPGKAVVDHVLGVPRDGELQALQQGETRAADGILQLGDEPWEKVTGGINGFRPEVDGDAAGAS